MIVVTAAQVTAAAMSGLDVTLVGVDGSVWDLVNGPVKLRPGVAGLTADPVRWWRDSPALDGSWHGGYRIPRGEVTLPVAIQEDTSLGWRDTQAAWVRAIDPSGKCFLRMRASDSVVRTVGMRYTSGLGAAYEISPLRIGYAAYTLEFATEDPYWRGATVSFDFTGSEIPVNTVGEAAIVVPGDVAPWPKWTAYGAFNSATFGVGSSTVTYNAAIANGRFVVVDQDPRADTIAVLDSEGVDSWLNVTNRIFAPITVGQSSTVRIGMGSPGAGARLLLEVDPAYRQPW